MSLTDRLFGGFGFSTGLSGLGDLKERRLAEAQAKYPGAEPTVKRIADADPSGNQKYLGWQLKQVLDLGEPIAEVIDLVAHFHRVVQRLPQKDLYSFKTLGQLRAAIEAIPSQSAKAVVAELKAQGAKLLHDTEHVAVLYLKDREASCLYGSGTQWCVSATKSRNYFYAYSMRDVHFYVVIAKALQGTDSSFAKVAFAIQRANPWKEENSKKIWNKPDDKLACHQRRLQIFNSLDKCFGLNDLWTIYAGLEAENPQLEGRLPKPVQILTDVINPHFAQVGPRPEYVALRKFDVEALLALVKKDVAVSVKLYHLLEDYAYAIEITLKRGEPLPSHLVLPISRLQTRIGQRLVGELVLQTGNPDFQNRYEDAHDLLTRTGIISKELLLGMLHQRFVVERKDTGMIRGWMRRLAKADEFAFAFLKILEQGVKGARASMIVGLDDYSEDFMHALVNALKLLGKRAVDQPKQKRAAMVAMFKKLSRFIFDCLGNGLKAPNNLVFMLGPETEAGRDFALSSEDKTRLMVRRFYVDSGMFCLPNFIKVFAHTSIQRDFALETLERLLDTPQGKLTFAMCSVNTSKKYIQRSVSMNSALHKHHVDPERVTLIRELAKSPTGGIARAQMAESDDALVRLRRIIAEDKKRKKARR